MKNIRVKQIIDNKKEYLNLLLLADEQESMIDRYLERGQMFTLIEGDVKAICVVTDEGHGICELKNLATEPRYQHQGYGKALVSCISEQFKGTYHTMIVGTGDSLLTTSFYQSCGFVQFERVENFFIDHYDHPIFEEGKQLIDMIYFKKLL